MNGRRYIEEAIAELNTRPHAFFSKYTREQVDLYIEARNTEDAMPKLYKERGHDGGDGFEGANRYSS